MVIGAIIVAGFLIEQGDARELCVALKTGVPIVGILTMADITAGKLQLKSKVTTVWSNITTIVITITILMQEDSEANKIDMLFHVSC